VTFDAGPIQLDAYPGVGLLEASAGMVGGLGGALLI
jgi:hypothetical protein